MALRFIDSFDHYATADITTKYNANFSCTIGSGGRNSTNALLASSYGTGVDKALTTSGATAIIGLAFKIVTGPNLNAQILHIKESNTDQCYLRLNTGLTISIVRGDGTVLATSSTALSTNTFYFLEWKLTINNSTGASEVRVDGVNIVSTSSADTQNTASATWDAVRILGDGGGASGSVIIDDLYICDGSGSLNNDFLGPVRVKAAFADGAGNYSQFTPSAGSNFQNVDETSQDGDTTYNSETTAGEKDTYTFAALGLTGTVKGVQTNLMVRSDAVGAETVAPTWRISSTDYDGTAVAVNTSYVDKTQVYETSPATAAAWTVSEIDGAEFGPKLVS